MQKRELGPEEEEERRKRMLLSCRARAARYRKKMQDREYRVKCGMNIFKLSQRNGRKDQLNLHGYVDSSFGANPKDGKSITGILIKLAGGPVDWRSHLQETTADSTNAAEYVALWEAAKAILGIANILRELQLTTTLPKLYEDTLRAMRLATAGMGQGRARHLHCKYHAIQDWTGTKCLQIEYTPTTRQVVDALTKGGHPQATLIKLITGMGLVTVVPCSPEGPTVRGSAQGGINGTAQSAKDSNAGPVGEMQADDKTSLTSSLRRTLERRAPSAGSRRQSPTVTSLTVKNRGGACQQAQAVH